MKSNIHDSLTDAVNTMWNMAIDSGRTCYMVQKGDLIHVTLNPSRVKGKVMGSTRIQGCLR